MLASKALPAPSRRASHPPSSASIMTLTPGWLRLLRSEVLSRWGGNRSRRRTQTRGEAQSPVVHLSRLISLISTHPRVYCPPSNPLNSAMQPPKYRPQGPEGPGGSIPPFIASANDLDDNVSCLNMRGAERNSGNGSNRRSAPDDGDAGADEAGKGGDNDNRGRRGKVRRRERYNDSLTRR